jgi:hypothetical protein
LVVTVTPRSSPRVPLAPAIIRSCARVV